MNAVVVAIPAKVRTWIYLVFAVVGLGFGATQVGYAAANVEAPTWLSVAIAVYTFVGGGIGYTAATHTPSAANEVQRVNGEVGAVGILAIIGLLLIAVAILGLLGVVNLGVAICVVLAIIGLLLLVVDWRGGLRR